MLSFFWLCVVCFVLAVYLLRPLRRILLYLLGTTLGHACLLFRHLTHNTAERQRKREYFMQNPKWKEHVQAKEAGKAAHSSAGKTAATTTTTGSPLASPSVPGRKPSFAVAATGSARNLHATTTPTGSATPSTSSPWARKGSTTGPVSRSPPAAAAAGPSATQTFTFDGKQFR